MITKKRFIVDLLDDDNNNETEQFIRKYGADEVTGTTNGDVIKALFNSYKWNEYKNDNGELMLVDCDEDDFVIFSSTWWNAPYGYVDKKIKGSDENENSN